MVGSGVCVLLNPGDPEVKPVVGRVEKVGEKDREFESEEVQVGTLAPVVAGAVGENVANGDRVISPVVGKEENDTEGVPELLSTPEVGMGL